MCLLWNPKSWPQRYFVSGGAESGCAMSGAWRWATVPGPAGPLLAAAAGRGELAVVLAGGPGLSCDYVLPLGELLIDVGFRVVCFHYRGVGGSAWPDPPGFSLEELARDVWAVVAAHGDPSAPRVHLVAHSFGGYVAWACLEDPERVASLTLLAACSPRMEANAAGDRALRRRIAALGALTPPTEPTARFHTQARAYFHDPSEPLPPALSATTAHPDVHARVLAETNDMRSWPRWAGAFRGRAHLVWGQSDPLGVAVAEANRAALPNALVRAAVVPAAGHFPWLEQSGRAAFVATLHRLLGAEARGSAP